MVSKIIFLYHRWFCQTFLAVLVIVSVSWNALHAGEPFSTHLDSTGRLVFTNETSPSFTPGSGSVQSPGPIARTRIHDLIEWTAGEHRVDPELIRAIVQVESNFNPNAVSPKGAMGLMQLIPATARRFGVSNAFDPKANLDGGIRYLKYLMELFNGDLQLTLAAYNAGENLVTRVGRVPSLSETRNYVRKISQLYTLDRPSRAASSAFTIEKVVDSKGVVHFSNTELP
ncbi:MAG: transglycosylase SLT domain-containing protein [Acidobacteria bacterium]|nr:transglycosylase SLT domain-containing protein [Acidobacteriota bacterium]